MNLSQLVFPTYILSVMVLIYFYRKDCKSTNNYAELNPYFILGIILWPLATLYVFLWYILGKTYYKNRD